MQQIPRTVKWITGIVILFFILLTLFRFIFYLEYKPGNYQFPGAAFLMGARIDLRSVCILGLFTLLMTSITSLNPFKNKKATGFWNFFLSFIFVIALFYYIVDFFHFDYLHQRLNASVLNYLKDAAISLSMVWQTYPVIKMILLLLILALVMWFIFSGILKYFQRRSPVHKKYSWVSYTLLILLLLAGTWGSLGQFPLRWSNVYTLGDSFKSQLALNPFQSFFSTLSFKNSTYDLKKVKEYYPLMSSYLGVDHPDPVNLNFERRYTLTDSNQNNKPNVVLVICESFSAYKSSMWGNALKTTPFFDTLCNTGIFFDHCFTPSYGTARGVWATITGIPDVEFPSTASRNPSIVDQRTIINDFKGYDKFYFLGGNANWANIRGLLKNNIYGLKLYEQDDYQEKQIDVWGVSDKNLFLNANKILAKQQKPFFAIIQTADNHRPYTIPKEDLSEFKKVELPEDTLHKYGFINNDELNAFRYTDFSYKKFIEASRNSPYFKNTVFIFVGDHGIRGDAADMFPKAWTEQALTTVHVPLLFYAPSLLTPVRNNNVCSQLDILPSIAGLLKIPFTNTAMGRNLFDSSLRQDRFRYSSAFIIDPDEKKIGIVCDNYYLRKMTTKSTTELVSVKDNKPIQPGPVRDSVTTKLSTLADAYYHTARYLLYHNKKGN